MREGLITPHTNSLHLLGIDDGPTAGPVLLLHSPKQLSEDGNKKMLAEYCKRLSSLQEWEHASRAHTNFFSPRNYTVSMKVKTTLQY